MTLSYAECLSLARSLKEQVLGAKVLHVWSLQSRRFLLEIQSKDSLLWLFICVQAPFARFHLIKQPPRQKQLCGPLEQYLAGRQVQDLLLWNQDRIVDLNLGKLCLRLEIFSRCPNLYVVDAGDRVLWSCFETEAVYRAPDIRQTPVQRPCNLTHEEVARRYGQLESAAFLQHEKRLLGKRLRQRIKAAERKLLRLEQDRQQAESWPELQHRADLLKAHFYLMQRGLKSIEVPDWQQDGKLLRLELDPAKTPEENLKGYYRRVRKSKGALAHFDEQRLRADRARQHSQKLMQELEEVDDLKSLQRWAKQQHLSPKPSKPQEAKQISSRWRRYYTESGWEILVGKSARDNDQLSFSVGRGTDWWLHVSGYPGAHVLLRGPRKGMDPDDQSLMDALQVALYHSKAKARGEAEVIVTQCKYLSRAPGAPGKVFVSKKYSQFVRIDDARYRKLKARSYEP